MKQRTYIFFIGVVLSLVILVSCEEYYTPALEEVPRVMVVDSRITNDPLQNFLHISKARTFYSTSAVEWVSGALVELVQDNFHVVKAREDAPGDYVFPSTPVPGLRYKLRITYSKDIYESEYIVMPPIPAIDSLYTRDEIAKVYKTNAYNVPELFDKPGRQIYIDAPVTPELQYYRFNYRAVMQWVFNPMTAYDSISPVIHARNPRQPVLKSAWTLPIPIGEDTSNHILYGWVSRFDKGLFNLAGPKEFSASGGIAKHPIVLLAYNPAEYLDSITEEPRNWIFILDQYGIPKASYDFHEKLNRQFSSDGSLFDPVMTQVFGNVKCITDPEKIVLGFFDLTSHRQYRYYLNVGTGLDRTVILRPLDQFFDIPDRGFTRDEPPIFWETNYKR
ncbi:MAG TPA: DUF4249 family protein [Prolixibacteraceae bacterium]|jgi:hypothetical protein